MNGYVIAVLAGWAMGLLALASTISHPAPAFRAAGTSRPRWLAINLIGLIPYLGLITASAYYLRVRTRLPARPRPVTMQRKPMTAAPQSPAPAGSAGNSHGGCRYCYDGTEDCNKCKYKLLPDWNCMTCHGKGKVVCHFCHGEYMSPVRRGTPGRVLITTNSQNDCLIKTYSAQSH